MANPINEALEEVGKSTVEMREKLDKMEEAQKKGEEARAKEKEIEGEKWNMQISKAYEEIKALKEEKERTVARLEIAEAFMDRPKGTQTEQLEQKQVELFHELEARAAEIQESQARCVDLEKMLRDLRGASVEQKKELRQHLQQVESRDQELRKAYEELKILREKVIEREMAKSRQLEQFLLAEFKRKEKERVSQPGASKAEKSKHPASDKSSSA